MADIKIVDLRPVGSEFFADDEGYLAELTEDDLSVMGGTDGGGGGGGNNSILNSNISALNSVGNTLGNVFTY